MAETVTQLKETLVAARAYLDAATDHIDKQVYSDGLQWTVWQVAVHLADADRGHNGQVMAFAEGREVIPEDFDIQRYNTRSTEKRADVTFE
jgi:hypothetical protein